MVANVDVGFKGGGPMNGCASSPIKGPGGGRGPAPDGGIGTLTMICPGRPGVSISSVRTNGFIGSGVPVWEEDGVVVMGGRTDPGTGGRATWGVVGGAGWPGWPGCPGCPGGGGGADVDGPA